MYFDSLFREFKDIQFQSQKILNATVIDQQQVEKYALQIERVKKSLEAINLDQKLSIYVQNIELINPDFQPEKFFGIGFLNLITFGWYNKRRIKQKRLIYFKTNVKILMQQFAHIEFLIKEL
jgi:hypothetical protein